MTEITSLPQTIEVRNDIQPSDRTKRVYQKVTQDQIIRLKKLYAIKGPSYSIVEYSNVSGIKPQRVKRLIQKLKAGIDIDKSTVRKGRMRILNDSDSILLSNQINNNDNRTTLRNMQAIIKEKNNKVVSLATIHRHLTTRMIPQITLKRFVKRGSKVNDIERLKDERIVVVHKLVSYIEQGYRPLFLDETHWMLGLVTQQARSAVGTTPVVHMACAASDITVIASMSDLGMGHTQIIYGPNSIPIFNTYIKYVLDEIKHLGRFVFFLDNCNIHHDYKTELMIINSGNKLLFNTTYSSPLNAIENIFGIWKQKAQCCIYLGREDIIQRITDTFNTITVQECYSTVQNILHTQHRKVLNREDI